MRTIIDFARYQSLGKTNNNELPGNFADFQSAQKIYQENKVNIKRSILETMIEVARDIEVGTTITIPCGHYENSGFVSTLTFVVDELTEALLGLSLTVVGHKIGH